MMNDETYCAFFCAAPIGLTVFDDEGIPIDCNDVMLSMLETDKDYYLANFFKFSPRLQPDGLSSRELFTRYTTQAIAGERLQFKWLHCTQDGESIPCSVTLSRIKSGDRFVNLSYAYDLRGVKDPEAKTEEAYRDELTGIYNRRYMGENLNGLISFLSRAKSVLSVMMLDIDHFKAFTDTYGREESDNCLKVVAEILANNITRTGDFVVRYGIDEFAIVLPNTDESGARTLSERLLEDMRSREIPHASSETAEHVTISIGVTTSKVNHLQVGGEYVRQADEMLQKSKQDGRNRYSFSKLGSKVK